MGQMHCSRCYCNATLVLQLYIENWLRWFPPDPGLLASIDLSNAWPSAMDQPIRYATSPDGVRIAYAVMGKGTPVVRASHWLTHLEYELNSPVWRHLLLGMATRHTLVRYDGRGTGLSQRDGVEISLERWVDDLACVVDSLSLERFVLLGVSQGGAISIKYAARHPERVSHLIIHGAYARGFLHRGNPDKQRQFVALNRALIREG